MWVLTRFLISLVIVSAAQPAPVQRSDVTASYTLLSRDGRRAIPARLVNGVEMFALDELAKLFGFTVREDPPAGGLVIALPARGQSVVLSTSQGLASAAGRVISLPAPPARDRGTGAWLVPVEFVGRALAPVYGTPLELRKPSRLVILGDLRVPQIVARHEAAGAGARVTFEIQPATPHNVSQDAGRLVVRFEADALDAQLPGAVARDLVAAVRPGDTPQTVAIDLGPRFGSFRASDAPGDRDGGRLIIDIFGPTGEAPPPAAPEPAPLPDFAPTGGVRTIVIDPGHGGDEHGARGPGGTFEKHVTLAVAHRLKGALEGRLGIRAILTRDADRTISLDERAAAANNNKADLFISLHANASIKASASGAEVFYLSLDEYGEEAARIARGESEALPVFGGGTREIEVILWEMAQARYIERSAEFAGLVEAALRERVPMSPRAIQQAPFRVLVGANTPAVLVEMGFLTNAAEERALAGDARQNEIVQALVDAVLRFRERHR
jgi:N-acetylmuramoyl-L-alanine amidase